MTPAFWLCLLLVVASGLSAYIGNEWGRKIGKRKLSIFRLRPKHSSTFLTVLLSMCLSLGMMGVLFVFSPQLQRMVFLPTNTDQQQTLQAYEDALAMANSQIQRLSKQEQPLLTAQLTDPLAAEAPTPENNAEQNPQGTSSSQPAQAPLQWATQPNAANETNVSAPVPQSESQTIRQPAEGSLHRPAVPAPTTSSPTRKPPAQNKTTRLASQPTEPGPRRATPTRLSSRRNASQLSESSTTASTAPATAAPASSTPQRAPETARPSASVQAPTQLASAANLPDYPTGTLFQLTLNGDLTPQESQQLQTGIQRLTQDYLQLLGIGSEALNWQSAQMNQEAVKLSKGGQYRLQVSLKPSQAKRVPVEVAILPLSTANNETFDPQDLLEAQRLTPNANRRSLQKDLQTVLETHAQQQLALSKNPPPRTPRVTTAQLPFEILNLEAKNGVITGELFLR